MFDSSMTAAAIAEKVAELQKAAGFTTQLVNPYGRGTSFITLNGWVALAALAALFIVVAGTLLASLQESNCHKKSRLVLSLWEQASLLRAYPMPKPIV